MKHLIPLLYICCVENTNLQYDAVINSCKDLFLKKTKDYGTSWRVMRTISITDQIFIKALRIRTIQEKKVQLVNDDLYSEFIGIINYAAIGIIQLKLNNSEIEDLPVETTELYYSEAIKFAKDTMLNKNHDYGEAWRNMSEESMVDLILVKIARIKQILQNDGKTIVSEGIDANFTDILNYSVFALILAGKF